MITTADDAAQFRDECLKWQKRFGLTDWSLAFKTATAAGEKVEALVEYDCDTREATVTYYIGVIDAAHPRDNAAHEILHILFADMLDTAIAASSDADKILAREEHKVIERLLKVLK